jgi:hypothetical protein
MVDRPGTTPEGSVVDEGTLPLPTEMPCEMCEEGSWPHGSLSCPKCDADLSYIEDEDWWE